MAQCVVIADDLTGGNATGVLFTKMGYKAWSVLSLDNLDPESLSECDCVVYPTDSRAVDGEEAYRRVYHAAKKLRGEHVLVYAKRIDSTLRGNLGQETDAILDVLGEDYIAVATPSFPSSGRVVAGGCLLVNGVPLHKTNIAIDPKTPVHHSDVEIVFREQSRFPVASLRFEDMMQGAEALAEKIRSLAGQGIRIITVDSITDEDLSLVADACILSGRKVVAVDPGVFTATLAGKLIKRREKKEKDARILVLVGSVNPNTTAQMEELWRTEKTHKVWVKTREFLEGEDRQEAEIRRVVSEVLKESGNYQVNTVTGDGIYQENRIDFTPYMERYHCSLDDVSGRINRSFAEIARQILKGDPSIRAIYTSGGDVTQCVCERFGAAGLDLKDEVLPLAAYGNFLGGEFDGMQIITKGGSQGGPGAIVTCVNYLKERL